MDSSGVASHSSGASLRAFDIAMIIIPIIFVALRFWSRALPRKSEGVRFWWDDWIILIALPFNIAACMLQIYAVDLGMGAPVKTIPPANLTQLLKVLWASYFMSDLGIMLPKASVLCFYARIFTTQSHWFHCGLWVAHTLNVAWWLSSIARCLLFCNPVQKYWEGEAVPGFCRSADALYIGSAVPSVVIDFFVLLLPLPIIACLSMKLGRKAMVTVLFVCGYLVIAISLGRLITSLKSGTALNEDLTYYGVTLIIWVAAEPAVSIIGCCLPVIFYLFQQCYLNGPTSVFGSKLAFRRNKESSSNRSSKYRDWARPTIKQQGYGMQESDSSLDHVTEELASGALHEEDATKVTVEVRDHEKGLYDGSVAVPQTVVKGSLDVRSNRYIYEARAGDV